MIHRAGAVFVAVLIGGAGSFASSAAATPEVALGGLVQVDAASWHSCAVNAGHQLRCWGEGDNGKLGVNSTTPHDTAVTVLNPQGTGPLQNVASVEGGAEFTCARLRSRQVRCWGQNDDGQLARGTNDGPDALLPEAVRDPNFDRNLSGVLQLAVGDYHACVLLVDRTARCWGWNGYGQLGIGTADPELNYPGVVRPVSASGALANIESLSAGYAHTCAVLTTGQVRCWGQGTGLGHGSMASSNRPVVVRRPSGSGALTGVAQVSAGQGFTCARLDNGQARCWGSNGFGQLGIGIPGGHRRLPAVVESPNGNGPLSSVRSVSAGAGHACAVVTTGGGQGRCWGSRQFGQVGDGVAGASPATRPKPVRTVSGPGLLTGVVQIRAGDEHTCARLTNGQARCWGYNHYGQLGDDGQGTDRSRPRVVQA